MKRPIFTIILLLATAFPVLADLQSASLEYQHLQCEKKGADCKSTGTGTGVCQWTGSISALH